MLVVAKNNVTNYLAMSRQMVPVHLAPKRFQTVLFPVFFMHRAMMQNQNGTDVDTIFPHKCSLNEA